MRTFRTTDSSPPHPDGDTVHCSGRTTTVHNNMVRCLLAEFLGKFTLIFLGTGAVVLADLGMGSLVSITLTHTLVLIVMAYAHGDISGSSINPAATLGLCLAGAIDRARVLPSIVVQLADGVVGGFGIQFAFGDMVAMSDTTSNYGAPDRRRCRRPGRVPAGGDRHVPAGQFHPALCRQGHSRQPGTHCHRLHRRCLHRGIRSADGRFLQPGSHFGACRSHGYLYGHLALHGGHVWRCSPG